MLTTPLIKCVLEGSWLTKAVLGQVVTKLLFWERILEATKVIVGSSFESSIISNNIYHWATEVAVVPELMGVLRNPEHPPGYATESHRHVHAFEFSACMLNIDATYKIIITVSRLRPAQLIGANSPDLSGTITILRLFSLSLPIDIFIKGMSR